MARFIVPSTKCGTKASRGRVFQLLMPGYQVSHLFLKEKKKETTDISHGRVGYNGYVERGRGKRGRREREVRSLADLFNSPSSIREREWGEGGRKGNHLHARIGNRSRADTGRPLIN